MPTPCAGGCPRLDDNPLDRFAPLRGRRRDSSQGLALACQTDDAGLCLRCHHHWRSRTATSPQGHRRPARAAENLADLRNGKPWLGRTVVVTHHAPSAAVSGEMTPLSPCFASDLNEEIEHFRPDAWIFGHTHRPAELRMPGGTLLCNVSVGYGDEFRNAEIEDLVRRGLIDLNRIGDRPQ